MTKMVQSCPAGASFRICALTLSSMMWKVLVSQVSIHALLLQSKCPTTKRILLCLAPFWLEALPTSSAEDQSVLVYYSVNKELNKWDSIQCINFQDHLFITQHNSPMINPNYSFHGLLLSIAAYYARSKIYYRYILQEYNHWPRDRHVPGLPLPRLQQVNLPWISCIGGNRSFL